MPATFPPIDREVLNGLRLGDESALEQIFRGHFSPLTEEALTELDDNDAACAPRVVEGAFLRAWHERGRFETPASLEDFLLDAVHDGALRERSRRAALHRFKAHEGVHAHTSANAQRPASVDESWTHLAAVLHTDPADHEALAHARGDLSRHHAAEHVGEMAKERSWKIPVALGVVALAVIVAAMWWLDRMGDDSAVTRALASSDTRVLSTPPGRQATVTLRDGSNVSLGADSRLSVPKEFGSTLRVVKLEGTAAFTAAPAAERPFEVRAGNAVITVTGTAFSVRAYPSDSAVIVRVREGKVAVRTDGASRTLAAGQALDVARDGSLRTPTAAAVHEALGWQDGQLHLVDRPLREVLPELARWYALDLTVENPALLHRRVTMSARLESPREAIAALEKSAKLRFGYAGKRMMLRDTAAAAAEPANGR